jgi:hypothetical protein
VFRRSGWPPTIQDGRGHQTAGGCRMIIYLYGRHPPRGWSKSEPIRAVSTSFRLAYQPPVQQYFSLRTNQPPAINQPTVLFSRNKSAPAISHQRECGCKSGIKRFLKCKKKWYIWLHTNSLLVW